MLQKTNALNIINELISICELDNKARDENQVRLTKSLQANLNHGAFTKSDQQDEAQHATVCNQLHPRHEFCQLCAINSVQSADKDHGNSMLFPREPQPQQSLSKFQLSCLVQFFAVGIDNTAMLGFPAADNVDLSTDFQRNRCEIFGHLQHLLQLDCSKENDIVSFYQILFNTTASNISNIAVDVGSTDDIEFQLCKIYANLLLMTLYSCSYVIAETFRGRMTQKILGELKKQKIEISAGRDRERRKALKHACCLLEAYDRLLVLDDAGIDNNWDRVYCAWYAGCVVEITGFLAREREMAELQAKLANFKQTEKAHRRAHLYSITEVNGSRRAKQTNRKNHGRKLSKPSRRITSTDLATQSPLRTYRISLYAPQSAAEVAAWQAYRDVTANMMNRSTTSPMIWYNFIPQMARRYSCVRYALMSTAESCKASLMIRNSEAELRQQCEEQSMKWMGEAFKEQRTVDQPKSAILMMALLLSCNELQRGHVNEAFIHIRGGQSLSQIKHEDTAEAKTATAYCKTFTQSLTEVQDPREPENKAQRLSQAIASLSSAPKIFDDVLKRVDAAGVPERDQISKILKTSVREISLIVAKWKKNLASEVGGRSTENWVAAHYSEEAWPWKTAMGQLDAYLDEGAQFNIKEFEIAMERTMPFYGLSKCGEDDDMRADVARLMMVGPSLRGKPATISVGMPVSLTSSAVC